MPGEEDILHQEDVEAVIEEVIEEGVGKTAAAIADVDQVGAVYSQAEINALVDSHNEVLALLRANGLVEEEEA